MYRRFTSIARNSEIAYAYDSGVFDHRSTMHAYFREYQTYGDALTAHSPDYAVTLDNLADYLASLAKEMLGNDELTQEMYFTMHRRPTARQIAFAASVIWKEGGKRRYYSLDQLKISSSPNKQYDKRYEEIREFHDGSPTSIHRILVQDYDDGLTKFIKAVAVYDWVMAHDGEWMEMPAVFLEWWKGDPANQRENSRKLRDAYEACLHLTEAYRLREQVTSIVGNFERSAERAKQPQPVSTDSGEANPQQL